MKVKLVSSEESPTPFKVADSTFFVRRVPEEKLREIQRKHRKGLARVNGTVPPEEMVRFIEAVEDDVLDYVVVRWEGLEGDPPCSRENKLLLPTEVRKAIDIVSKNAVLPDEQKAQENFASPSASPSS